MPRLDNYLTNKEKKVRDSSFDLGRIYMAEVMDTRNVDRAGDIKVWVMGSDVDRLDSRHWVTASYAPPFYGTSPYDSYSKNDFEHSPKSFGQWFPIPFVGNYVFIFYPCITGENIMPYWFACPINPMANTMIPGIPSQYYGDKKVPVCELNDKIYDSEYTKRQTTLAKREEGRCEYKPLKNALERQGLSEDKLRGLSTAGAKRESPSMCYGVLTPMGNSFVMDDGWEDDDNRQDWNVAENTNTKLHSNKDGSLLTEKAEIYRKNAGFRFRTRNGTQLLISDDGNIYMINANGSAWAEITDDGSLQGYAEKSASIACDGDINLKSKKKIRMEADEGFVFKTPKTVSFEAGGDISVSSPHTRLDSNLICNSIQSQNGVIDTFTSEKMNANGTFTGTLQGTAFYATNSGIIPVAQPLPEIILAEDTNAIIENAKEIQGQLNGDMIETIVSECPTHEPYAVHNKNEQIPDVDISLKPLKELNETYNPMFISNQIGAITPIPPDTSKDTSIPNINLTEHFKLADLCYSDTAFKYGINNVPDEFKIAKLKILAEKILEPIWKHYNKRVIVNSGYRGQRLNAVIGGASTSQHSYGEAADIEISGISNMELATWIKDNLEFDQLILEYADRLHIDPNSGWVHVSYRTDRLRKQVLTINRSGTVYGLKE